MKAKKEYCGGCYYVKLCKAVYVEDMGGWEDWLCKKCRDEVSAVHKLTLL